MLLLCHIFKIKTSNVLDETNLKDFSYPWATFYDLPRKIKIIIDYKDNLDDVQMKNCATNQLYEKDELEKHAKEIAEAIGRVPGYARGALKQFEMWNSCKSMLFYLISI